MASRLLGAHPARVMRHHETVRIDSRIAALAVLTVAVAIGLGFLAGAWAGVLAAFAGLIPTALWELVRERGERDAAETARRKAMLAQFPIDPTTAGSAAGPSTYVPERGAAWYLRPEAQVVPFWPRPELDELRDWCVATGYLGVRLVTGSGGAGKTRLAVQLTHELADTGWSTIWVPYGSERAAVGAVRTMGGPALLIVDYAETRLNLADMLAEAAGAGDAPDMRVLLLARSPGEWWQRILDGAAYSLSVVLETATPVNLGPVIVAGKQNEVFDKAVVAFAERLHMARPNVEFMLTDPNAVVLVIHAAALLAVLDHVSARSESGQPQTEAEVLAGLLRHESRYWHKAATARGLALDPSVESLAVTVGCLIGAHSEANAIAMLTRISDLADSAERRGQTARWLHDLYPVVHEATDDRSGDWIGPLRPDRVAEQLVVTELSSRPDEVPNLLSTLGKRQAFRALTVLGRAALADPQAVSLLKAAFDADFENLAIPALTVAIETNPSIAELINHRLATLPPPIDMLERIADALPYPTIALADTAVAVYQLLVDQTVDDHRHAEWLVALSMRLAAVGRHEEALALSNSAARSYRNLAKVQPAVYLNHLATSLNNLSADLSDQGRLEESLAAITEAVSIRRDLARASASAFLPSLAMSLSNESTCLSDLGRWEQALAASHEATSIYRTLAKSQPDKFLSHLAMSLDSESVDLSTLGAAEDALAASGEAIAIYRTLAKDRSDALLPDLATALSNHSNHLSDLGRHEEALTAIEESVMIRGSLSKVQPKAFTPVLALGLNNQSNRLADLERWEEALTVIEESTAIYRSLSKTRPGVFLDELAASLHNQSWRLSSLGRLDQALAASEEAVSIYRGLAMSYPDRFLPRLARTLFHLADVLSALDRQEAADAAKHEARAIRDKT